MVFFAYIQNVLRIDESEIDIAKMKRIKRQSDNQTAFLCEIISSSDQIFKMPN